MESKKWLRALLLILGTAAIFCLLLQINLNTPKVHVDNGGVIDLRDLGDETYLLTDCWETFTDNSQIISTATLTFRDGSSPYALYMPRGSAVELLINGSSENVIAYGSHLVSILDLPDGDQTINIKITLSALADSNFSDASIFIGSYRNILSTIQNEGTLRIFIVGLSFALLLYAVSLYLQKRSEKYLLVLAAMVYSTFSYILLRNFPFLQENDVLKFLLLGGVNLPVLPAAINGNLHLIFYALLVAVLNYFLLRNFVSTRLFRREYIDYVVVASAVMLPLAGTSYFSDLHQIYRILINLLEAVIIVKGSYKSRSDSAVLLAGAIGTLAFRCFSSACAMNLVARGTADLLYRLGGITASFYAIAFVIAINGIFARKFNESEKLAGHLQIAVEKRTAELKNAYEKLTSEQKAHDAFMANMVHDLKTPLFSLSGYTDMARDSICTNPERTERCLNQIDETVSYVGTMVNNLFLSLRLEDGRVKFMRDTVSLHAVVSRVFDTTLALTGSIGIKLSTDLPEDVVSLEGDPYYLQQAVQNIVDNAVRHTSAGGEITIRLHSGSGQAVITVSDTGDGIPLENLPHIFDRYFSHSEKGTASSGLGLTISNDIVRAHGGIIKVESTTGKGSTFTIILPKAGGLKN
ncbi:HAMP domain-containing sensor histidine kinase [Desulfitobacterium sp. THU1]|uniref:sensor histidine kinase n=1 Tax=Desulfitobacterium sp. THU1 TaxID=3138072 RepID=UPI00311D6C43